MRPKQAHRAERLSATRKYNMQYLLAIAAIFFVPLSICVPGALLTLPATLDSSNETGLLLPCNGGIPLNVSSSASKSTTSLCAFGPGDWDAWQKIRVLSGRKGTYRFRAHPVKAGNLYRFEIQTSRKIDTLDLTFQDESLEQYDERKGVMISHNKFGPFTMEAARDGILFVTLHFRQSILPFWGKTRTMDRGPAPRPSPSQQPSSRSQTTRLTDF